MYTRAYRKSEMTGIHDTAVDLPADRDSQNRNQKSVIIGEIEHTDQLKCQLTKLSVNCHFDFPQ